MAQKGSFLWSDHIHLTDFFRQNQSDLFYALTDFFTDKGEAVFYKDNAFLYVPGVAPCMLIAHLDTVHRFLPEKIVSVRKKGDIFFYSPQGIGGDDRCGVFALWYIYNHINLRPHLLFLCDEEKGGIGAQEYIESICDDMCSDNMYDVYIPDIKYMIELDRQGKTDAVFYGDRNEMFQKFICKYGYKKAIGSFSDISYIAPFFGISAVNLSIGYYNAHTLNEYVCVNDMMYTIKH